MLNPKGFFLLLDEDQQIIKENSFFTGFEKGFEDRYMDIYYEKDYIQYLYDFSKETTVFQDSVMLEDESRQNTEFYKHFLIPSDIPYGAGILIIRNSRIIGIFNLFRSKAQGDFSERDIYILNIMKKHLENIIHSTLKMRRHTKMADTYYEVAAERFHLSDREVEILKLVADGKTNAEICDIKNISLSTVKKHIYNIFNKAGVNSRTQLLNMTFTFSN